MNETIRSILDIMVSFLSKFYISMILIFKFWSFLNFQERLFFIDIRCLRKWNCFFFFFLVTTYLLISLNLFPYYQCFNDCIIESLNCRNVGNRCHTSRHQFFLTAKIKQNIAKFSAIISPTMATRQYPTNYGRGGFFCSRMCLASIAINFAPCNPAKPTKILAAER